MHGADERIILRCILKWGNVGYCGHAGRHTDSIRGREYLEYMSDC
jgi:hypothetical protein